MISRRRALWRIFAAIVICSLLVPFYSNWNTSLDAGNDKDYPWHDQREDNEEEIEFEGYDARVADKFQKVIREFTVTIFQKHDSEVNPRDQDTVFQRKRHDTDFHEIGQDTDDNGMYRVQEDTEFYNARHDMKTQQPFYDDAIFDIQNPFLEQPGTTSPKHNQRYHSKFNKHDFQFQQHTGLPKHGKHDSQFQRLKKYDSLRHGPEVQVHDTELLRRQNNKETELNNVQNNEYHQTAKPFQEFIYELKHSYNRSSNSHQNILSNRNSHDKNFHNALNLPRSRKISHSDNMTCPYGNVTINPFLRFPRPFGSKYKSKTETIPRDCSSIWYSDVALPAVALASAPGSGNTWLRHLIQQLTGKNSLYIS